MVPIIHLRWLERLDVSYSFFNNRLSRTRIPALSRRAGGLAAAGVDWGGSAAVDLPFAAIAADLLYHRLPRLGVELKRPVGVVGKCAFHAIEGRGPC